MQQPGRPGGRSALLAALLAGLFVALAVVAHTAANGTTVDHVVLSWLIEHRHGWLTTVAIVITTAGSPVAVALLAVLAAGLLWWRRSSPIPGVVIVATLAAATATSTLTKAVVGAHRPPESVQLVLEVDPSFPSGHVTGTMALVGIIAVVVGRNRGTGTRLALACAVMTATIAVALTRLYLGVHWLTDVCGGVLLGGVAVILGASALTAVTRSHRGQAGRRAESATTTGPRVA